VAQQLGGGFDAVHAGQAYIHQSDLRLGSLAQTYGIGAAFGFADHAKLVTSLENAPDAIAHQLVVVDENDI